MRTVLLAMCLATGCMSIAVTEINHPPHALSRRLPDEVEVFSSGAPTRSHVDVALISVRDTVHPDMAHFVDVLRDTAGKMGCDAIALQPADIHHVGLVATCIVYSDQPPSMARE